MTLLLIARGLGALGFQILAVWMSFRIYEDTDSFFAVGSLGLGIFVSTAGAALFGGVMVDRLSRRNPRILFGVQTALCALAIVTFIFLGDSPILLFGAAMLLSFLRQLRAIIYVKTLSAAVERGAESGRIAKWNAFSWQSAQFLGPALFSRFAFAPALAVLCLAISAALVAFEAPWENSSASLPKNGRHAFRNGWDAFRRAPLAFRSWLTDSAVTLFLSATALLPFILFRNGIDPKEAGTVRAAVALGAVFVSFAVPYRSITKHARFLFAASLVGVGVSSLLFAHASSFAEILSLAGVFGAFDGLSVIVRDEWLLRSVPRDRMGSVGAITLILISISDDLGEFRAGAFAELFGLNATFQFGGLVALLAGVHFWMKTQPFQHAVHGCAAHRVMVPIRRL